MFGVSLFPGTTLAARAYTVAAVSEATVARVEPEVQMDHAKFCDANYRVAVRPVHAR